MSERNSITVERERSSLRDSYTLEVDAVNGLSSIPGVAQVQVESVTGTRVVLTYTWQGSAPFDRTDEHLSRFGLRKVWPD